MTLVGVQDLTAADIMKSSILSAKAKDKVKDILKKFQVGDFAAVLVAGEEMGVILPEMLYESKVEVTAEEIMLKNIIPVQATASLEDIVNLLSSLNNDSVIIVEEDNKVEGVVYIGDVILLLWQCLNVTEGRLKGVMESVNEAITIIDELDTVVGWNYKAEDLYGIKKSQILGKKINAYFTNLVVTEARKLDKVYKDTYHQPCHDTHVVINATPVKVAGNVVGSVSSERDITETVYLHRELTKASSKVRKLEKAISKINSPKDPFAKIIGKSKKLKEAISMARRVAVTNASVLIRGESGTGKELFAEAIHEESSRKDKPFVVVNCGAIPMSLFESEFFGYNAGAFTGADKKGKPGKFELANHGTIFLDEIGELQLEMQVKLLRVLQNKVFYRVGGREPIHIDVRVIAATNRDLEKMIAEGTFRKDLYYRLNVVSLDIPNLRERKEDIADLVSIFLKEFASLYNKELINISPELMSLLLNYSWPGNVRELRNVVERLVILSEGGLVDKEQLPEEIKNPKITQIIEIPTNLVEQTEKTERTLILKTLEENNGNKSKTARALGIPRSTLYYKMKTLNINYK